MNKECEVAIIGAGNGGLTLALALHEAGINCRVYEAVPELKPLGVGINILPHATGVLGRLGANEALSKISISTQNASFFNQYGQHIYTEALGTNAGYATPQFSIHRGELQLALLKIVEERLGADSVVMDRRCIGATTVGDEAHVQFENVAGEKFTVKASVVISCDGLHSALRKQFYPDEGAPHYTGVNMWRGALNWSPFLDGATFARAGALTADTGKMVIYPILSNPDGTQLMNWVAETVSPQPAMRDWNRQGSLDDFFPVFKDWHFDWLDVAKMIESTQNVLVFPMVDQEPLPRWTHGRVTLLGDAAHPMVPRGSNGAGQAIMDAEYLTAQFVKFGVGTEALEAYDRERVTATGNVVLANRKAPPDKILQVVHERTGGKPFASITDVISLDELREITSSYKAVAGYTLEGLANKAA